MKLKLSLPLFSLAVVLLTAPSCGSLDIDPQLPGPGDNLATPEQLLEASATLYRDWYNAAHAVQGPALALATAADQLTTTDGLAAAKDMALEPRTAFNNNPDYSYMQITENFWATSYHIVLLANDILLAMEEKDNILYEGKDLKPMLSAWAYFIRGLGYGYLGLLYDQANLVDIHSPLPVEEFSDYHKVVSFATQSIDTAIIIAQNHSFDMPDDFIRGVSLDAQTFVAMASSYEARILAGYPRNDADLQYVAWQKVLDLTEQGITEDLAPATNNDTWRNEALQYMISEEWGGVDLRLLHLLDGNYPAHWPADNSSWDTPNGQIPDSSLLNSEDTRAVTFLEWSPPKSPGTPYYLNTLYRISKYDTWAPDASGPVPELTLAENDLLRAEALVRLGNVSGAIAVINQGSRVNSGHLPPLATDTPASEVLKAIFYEREIELMATGTGISFFDMRRRNMLQSGTPLHFPVPGRELKLMGLPVYTYGGVENADGINTSNGGWKED